MSGKGPSYKKKRKKKELEKSKYVTCERLSRHSIFNKGCSSGMVRDPSRLRESQARAEQKLRRILHSAKYLEGSHVEGQQIDSGGSPIDNIIESRRTRKNAGTVISPSTSMATNKRLNAKSTPHSSDSEKNVVQITKRKLSKPVPKLTNDVIHVHQTQNAPHEEFYTSIKAALKSSTLSESDPVDEILKKLEDLIHERIEMTPPSDGCLISDFLKYAEEDVGSEAESRVGDKHYVSPGHLPTASFNADMTLGAQLISTSPGSVLRRYESKRSKNRLPLNPFYASKKKVESARGSSANMRYGLNSSIALLDMETKNSSENSTYTDENLESNKALCSNPINFIQQYEKKQTVSEVKLLQGITKDFQANIMPINEPVRATSYTEVLSNPLQEPRLCRNETTSPYVLSIPRKAMRYQQPEVTVQLMRSSQERRHVPFSQLAKPISPDVFNRFSSTMPRSGEVQETYFGVRPRAINLMDFEVPPQNLNVLPQDVEVFPQNLNLIPQDLNVLPQNLNVLPGLYHAAYQDQMTSNAAIRQQIHGSSRLHW